MAEKEKTPSTALGASTKSETALREERVLEFWKSNKIFEKSLSKKAPKGNYVFYDGPPFATGTPHYGHILGSTVKDVIGRYQTMRGYSVPRRWGWDCHGLPIENIVEKDLNISGKKAIEELGINKFVEHARSKVLTYVAEWEKTINRMGRWVDFRNSYKTMDNTFIESVWWALGELQKKDLLYEGVRILAYCPRCETPIANSEIAMDNSYKDISDISVYVKFELEDDPSASSRQGRTYLLAWTTTPWTLPGNTAIAINNEIVYVKIKLGEEKLILAKEILQNVLKDKEYTVLGEMKGEGLIGKKYKPLFPYYKNSNFPNKENIWKVWHADFVTLEKGTGIAHQAPAFGEDDMNLAKKNNIPWIIHVDETGKFKPEVVDFAGLPVKPKSEEKDGHQKADIEIIKYLAKNGTLFEKEKIIHSYPHCYRCETPLLYYALPSWFVNIQKAKGGLLENAKSMNWIPAHLKEGRFKNTMENAPDWTISRNRYWASPLPFWKSKSGKIIFVNSIEDLKNKTKKSGNKYFVMRHGEAENNAKNIYSSNQKINHMTEKGRAQVLETVRNLKDKKFTKIYCSPFLRTRETAEIVAEQIDFPRDRIIYDDRIRELEFGDFSDRSLSEYWDYMKNKNWGLETKIPGGESFQDAKNRIGDFLYDIDQQNESETILIVSHGLAVEIVPTIIAGADQKRSLEILHSKLDNKTASLHREHEFIPLPHNENYELDLHRPYIDEITLIDDNEEEYKRIPEVIDCWFESGSIPFAQDHYPFENPDWRHNNFPSGFVAEYIAQTRTWFYYTHVISSILFNHAPFENVVTTGTILAEDGQKMSKSKNNFPDPADLFDKYGVDPLRFYLMSGPLMKGEDINFSEKLVQEISNKIIGRLFNVFAFYELYRDKNLENNSRPKANNVLDKWILLRLDQTIEEVSLGMKRYDLVLATRPFEIFIEDLSIWYLRRSREKLKDSNLEAKQTLYFVLKTLIKILAPFTPFISEFIWLKLRGKNDEESVHLADWPKAGEVNSIVIANMETVRKVVTLGLEARQKAGIKVRQPLNQLRIRNYELGMEYTELIKDELNVKEVKEDKNIEGEVELDTKINEELKLEGDYRELARALQDMRKKRGLTPSDVVALVFETDDAGRKLIEKFENEIKKTVLASKIEFKENDGEEIKIDELVFKVKIKK